MCARRARSTTRTGRSPPRKYSLREGSCFRCWLQIDLHGTLPRRACREASIEPDGKKWQRESTKVTGTHQKAHFTTKPHNLLRLNLKHIHPLSLAQDRTPAPPTLRIHTSSPPNRSFRVWHCIAALGMLASRTKLQMSSVLVSKGATEW